MGFPPGGLASNGYGGHTFWDQETWMWPPLLMMDLPSARSALQYRYERREGAHNKSLLCGLQDTRIDAAWCPHSYKADASTLMFP